MERKAWLGFDTKASPISPYHHYVGISDILIDPAQTALVVMDTVEWSLFQLLMPNQISLLPRLEIHRHNMHYRQLDRPNPGEMTELGPDTR